MAHICNTLSQLIGRTPLLEVSHLNTSAKVLAKLECFNPAGSVKDRAALFMLEDARQRGILTSNSVIIEPTSGNTGIGLCALAASMGLRCIIVMPDTMSVERDPLPRCARDDRSHRYGTDSGSIHTKRLYPRSVL